MNDQEEQLNELMVIGSIYETSDDDDNRVKVEQCCGNQVVVTIRCPLDRDVEVYGTQGGGELGYFISEFVMLLGLVIKNFVNWTLVYDCSTFQICLILQYIKQNFSNFTLERLVSLA